MLVPKHWPRNQAFESHLSANVVSYPLAGIQNTVLHFLPELPPTHSHPPSRNAVKLDRLCLDISTLAEVLLKTEYLDSFNRYRKSLYYQRFSSWKISPFYQYLLKTTTFPYSHLRFIVYPLFTNQSIKNPYVYCLF